MRLGIFGGTFDPPHIAHLIAGERCVETYALDQLLFVPAHIPPHKQGHALTSAEHRLAMLQLAIQNNERFAASDLELRRPPPSYMIDTLRELKQSNPADELYLFIGFDQLEIFTSWRKYEAIMEEANVIAIARPPFDRKPIPKELQEKVQFCHIPLLEISSTDIRKRVRNGKSIRYLVPDRVGLYIEEQGLYR